MADTMEVIALELLNPRACDAVRKAASDCLQVCAAPDPRGARICAGWLRSSCEACAGICVVPAVVCASPPCGSVCHKDADVLLPSSRLCILLQVLHRLHSLLF